MKVLVLGAGAVGLSVAAILSRVCEVHAVARKKTAEAIRACGFTLTGIRGTDTYRFSVADTVPSGARYDYAICREFATTLNDTRTVSLVKLRESLTHSGVP